MKSMCFFVNKKIYLYIFFIVFSIYYVLFIFSIMIDCRKLHLYIDLRFLGYIIFTKRIMRLKMISRLYVFIYFSVIIFKILYFILNLLVLRFAFQWKILYFVLNLVVLRFTFIWTTKWLYSHKKTFFSNI